MAKRSSDAYRQDVLARFDALRAAGQTAEAAAAAVGHHPSVISMWRSECSAVDPSPARQHVAKRRACLRCGGAFKSAWAGERICAPCKDSPYFGLPGGW